MIRDVSIPAALVAGTAVFRGGRENYAANIRALRGEIALT